MNNKIRSRTISSRQNFLLVFYCLFAVVSCFAQQTNVDSLLKIIEVTGNDTNKANMLNDLCWQYYLLGDLDKANNEGDSALELSLKIKFRKGEGNACSRLGLVQTALGNYPLALQYHTRTLEICKAAGNTKRIGNCYTNIGIVNIERGDYPEALKYFFLSLHLAEDLRDKPGIARAKINIGNVYYRQQNYEESVIYYSASLAIRKEIADPYGVSECYSSLANVSYDKGNYDDALKNYLVSLEIFQKAGNKTSEGICLNNIGNVYEAKKNYEEALKNLFAALKIAQESRNMLEAARCFVNISGVYIKQKKYTEAEDALKNSLKIAVEIGDKEEMKESFIHLAAIDSVKGDFKRALGDYKMYILYRDSLVNEENTKKAVQTQMQYDFNKKTTADSIKNAELVKQENLKHDQKIQQQKIYTYGGVIGFLLMLVVAGVSFNAYRQKRSANEIITHQKYLVEEKQKEILDSIHYAKRIQQSLLPTEKYIDKNLKRIK